MLEIIGSLLGMLGAVCVAVGYEARKAGFAIWMVSNVMLVLHCAANSQHWMVMMFLFLTITSAIGYARAR